jgi:DNA-binding SARP family transcriptional activator
VNGHSRPPEGPRIEFRVLGSLDLRGPEGGEILSVLAQPKRVCLLTYLAVHAPEGVRTRDELIQLFWPDLSRDRGRAAVRKSLHFLRQSLGENALESGEQDEVWVNQERLWCDAAAFLGFVEGGEEEAALELYRGDLLEGVVLPECPGFEGWLEKERARFRELAAGTAWALAQGQIEEGRLANAERTGQRALSLAGSDEKAVQAFMRLLAGAGDPAAAVRFYGKFTQGLERDSGLDPSAEIQELAEEIRAGAEAGLPIPATSADLAEQVEDGLAYPLPRRVTAPPRIGWVGAKPLALSGWVFAAVFAAVAGWAILTLRDQEPPPVRQIWLDLGESMKPTSWRAPPGVDFSLSPDGLALAYVGRGQEGWGLWLKRAEDLDPRPLPVAERARHPVFSPDGRSLAYESVEGIKVVSVEDGAIETLVAAPGDGGQAASDPISRPRNPWWSEDGHLYFAQDSIVKRIPAEGGRLPDSADAEEISNPTNYAVHLHPSTLPGGRGLLVTVARDPPDSSRIGVVDSDGGEVREIFPGAMARYAPSGHIVYATADGGLWSRPFDLGTLTPNGRQEAIADTVEVKGDLASQFALSEAGHLLYRTRPPRPADPSLVWVSPDGTMEPADSAWIDQFVVARLSPDGSRIAASVAAGTDTWDIKVKEVGGGPPLRLATAHNPYLEWGPDGESVTFISDRQSRHDVWRVAADGTGEAELVLDSPLPITRFTWSPTGGWLAYEERQSPLDLGDILAIRPGIDVAPMEIAAASGRQRDPAFSPDGRWLAYESSGGIYVVPFPNLRSGDWSLETNWPWVPFSWSRDGRALFLWQSLGLSARRPSESVSGLEVIDVTYNPSISLSPPRRFSSITDDVFEQDFDVSEDGTSFLMIRRPDLNTQVYFLQYYFRTPGGN